MIYVSIYIYVLIEFPEYPKDRHASYHSLIHSLYYRLHYNSTTGRYTNTPGVKIRVPEFGNTTAVETLDPNFDSAAYFDKFVEYFANLGYQSGVDILAAAFDWRLGPGISCI